MSRQRKTFVPAPGVKPISAKEWREQAQRLADEEAAYQQAQRDAEATFKASVAAITPEDPFSALVARVAQLEDQMIEMREWRAKLDRAGVAALKEGDDQ